MAASLLNNQAWQCTVAVDLAVKGDVDTHFMCLKHQQNVLWMSKECHIESTDLTCQKRQLPEPTLPTNRPLIHASHVKPICSCLPGTLSPDCTGEFMVLGFCGSEIVYNYKQIKLTHGKTLEVSTRPLQFPA